MSVASLIDMMVGGVLTGLVYGLAALGLAVIFGVVRTINFAHGGLMVAGLYAAGHGADPLLALPVVAGVLFVAGFGLQRLLFERVAEPGSAASEPLRLLLMAGFALVVMNGLLLLFGPDSRGFHLPAVKSVPLAVGPLLLDRLRVRAALVAVMVTALLFAFFNISRTGKAIRACADNPEGARIAGLDLPWLRAVTFGLGAAVTGLAGGLLARIGDEQPALLVDGTVTGLIIMLIGGCGSVGGALVGGVLVGLAEAAAGAVFGPALKGLFGYGLLVLVLLWRPRGLLGEAPR
jgi:branched-chain amino acid transport system permease protein